MKAKLKKIRQWVLWWVLFSWPVWRVGWRFRRWRMGIGPCSSCGRRCSDLATGAHSGGTGGSKWVMCGPCVAVHEDLQAKQSNRGQVKHGLSNHHKGHA